MYENFILPIQPLTFPDISGVDRDTPPFHVFAEEAIAVANCDVIVFLQ